MDTHTSYCCNSVIYISGRNGGRTLRVYCRACNKLQDTYRAGFRGWSEHDLNELDVKFDALIKHLGIEFVFEKISDGSDTADKERLYIRNKEDK